MPPSTRARPRSSGGSTRSGPATIGRATARGDAASLLAAAMADRPSSQPASEPARRTTVDALRKSQAAMLQGQGPATASPGEERASKQGSEGHRVPLPFAWFSKPAQAGEKRPPVFEGRRFAGSEAKASVQTAAAGSPESKVTTPTAQRKDTTYGSTFTDLSAHTEALKPAETIYHAKAEFDQWLASVGGDPRRTVSAAALREREGETEHRKAYRAWSAQEMADAQGSSQFLEERSRAVEEVRRLAVAQARQRGEEARARQAAATAAAASTFAATSSIAAATPAPPKAAWATATAEDSAGAAASISQRRSTPTLARPSSAPAARKVSKSKPPSEVTSSRGSIPSVVPEIQAMLLEAAVQELAAQEQTVFQPVHVCGSEAAASRCGSKDARSEKSGSRPATAEKAAERTLKSSAGKRPKSASSIASRSTAAASAASDDGWPWHGKGNAGSRPQTADSVSSLGSSASTAGRPRTASSGISQAASAAGSTASRPRSAASRRSEESLRKMLEKANGGKSSKGSKSASSVGAGSASRSSVRGAAYMPRPASVATSQGTAW